MDPQKQNGDGVAVSISQSNGARNEDGVDSAPAMGASGDRDLENEMKSVIPRAEIDTSAPFGSVKEAATRFGGVGFWKPSACKPCVSGRDSQAANEVADANVEEEAVRLERDLIVKERETFAVLEELERTKTTMEELKVKLQKASKHGDFGGSVCWPSSAPGLILMELKQAKLNLSKTTHDIMVIRAAVESYSTKIENERIMVEKTKRRLASSSLKVSCLEQELDRTKLVKDCNGDSCKDCTWELQKLSFETEQLKKVKEDMKSEIVRAMCEIEQTKARLNTAETRLVAAKKIKEAARATEAAALAEINSLFSAAPRKPEEEITLTVEEYSSLTSIAQDSEEAVGAALMVDEANVSRTEILGKVEKATEEVKLRKAALEEALSRVEAANRDKLEVEEAMRKWRSDHGQRKCCVQNSISSQHQRGPPLLDVNGLTLVNEDSSPTSKSTLSIGQILSRKLLSREESERVCVEKSKGSLAQMFCKSGNVFNLRDVEENAHKVVSSKRKKFSLSRISLVRKQGKKMTSKFKVSYSHAM